MALLDGTGATLNNRNSAIHVWPAITDLMKQAGKTYDPVTYEGAGHGFMREGEVPDSKDANHEANVKAREEAWKRWKDSLKGI